MKSTEKNMNVFEEPREMCVYSVCVCEHVSVVTRERPGTPVILRGIRADDHALLGLILWGIYWQETKGWEKA